MDTSCQKSFLFHHKSLTTIQCIIWPPCHGKGKSASQGLEKQQQLVYNQFYTSLILMHFDASAKKSWGTWFMDEFIWWFVMGCNYILDDVLQDLLFLEITVSSLRSLDVEKHFDLALASPWNVQIHFFCQVHKIISVLPSAIRKTLQIKTKT